MQEHLVRVDFLKLGLEHKYKSKNKRWGEMAKGGQSGQESASERHAIVRNIILIHCVLLIIFLSNICCNICSFQTCLTFLHAYR